MSNFPWSDYTFTADRFQVIANNEGGGVGMATADTHEDAERLAARLNHSVELEGRLRGLATRLDDISDRCAHRATKYGHPGSVEDLSLDLLARATTYQECAGLIRETLK